MKKKKIFKALILMVALVSIIFFIGWNSELNKNNRYLNDKLLNSVSDTSGKAGELFDFNYDKVYVFSPYQSKDEMEKELGFSSRLLKETVSEGMMNILFVKDDSPAAYLYGYGSNNGYYLALPAGRYSKLEVQNIGYKVTTYEVGNSSGREKTYLNYDFEF